MTQEQETQYKALIKARNFHYENLNKWLSFFYVAIAAIFAGFCTLHKNAMVSANVEIIVIAVLYLVSLSAYLSGKGYYFWEQNWIMLLHDFENKHLINKQEDYRVYSVFANYDKLNKPCCPVGGANISTSKVALLMTFILTILWGAMLVYWIVKTYWGIGPCCKGYVLCLSLLGSIVGTLLLVLLGSTALKSNFKSLDDLELTNRNNKQNQ